MSPSATRYGSAYWCAMVTSSGYERAAVRWLGRFALEARGASLDELQQAAAALDALRSRADAGIDILAALCVRHGLGEHNGHG